jgi:hypothetical protein
LSKFIKTMQMLHDIHNNKYAVAMGGYIIYIYMLTLAH